MAAPVITPGGPLTKDGKSVTNFTSDILANWTATGGTFSGVVLGANNVNWTAPNKTGTWDVVATRPSFPAEFDTVIVTVRAVIPPYWTRRIPITAKKEVAVFQPIYGSRQWRGFGLNEKVHEWELGNPSQPIEKFVEMKEFWDYHYPGKLFDLVDPDLQERRTFEIDSDFGEIHTGADDLGWSFRIKEAYPYASTPA